MNCAKTHLDSIFYFATALMVLRSYLHAVWVAARRLSVNTGFIWSRITTNNTFIRIWKLLCGKHEPFVLSSTLRLHFCHMIFFFYRRWSKWASFSIYSLVWIIPSHETQTVQGSYYLLFDFKVALGPGDTVMSDLCKGCTDSSDILESHSLFRKTQTTAG